jgi:hypothetical protein
MATLTELREIFSNSDLTEKILSATVIGAYDLLSGTPTNDDVTWCASVFNDPITESRKARMFVISANSDLSIAQILGATDEQIQNQVNQVIPLLVQAMASA